MLDALGAIAHFLFIALITLPIAVAFAGLLFVLLIKREPIEHIEGESLATIHLKWPS